MPPTKKTTKKRTAAPPRAPRAKGATSTAASGARPPKAAASAPAMPDLQGQAELSRLIAAVKFQLSDSDRAKIGDVALKAGSFDNLPAAWKKKLQAAAAKERGE